MKYFVSNGSDYNSDSDCSECEFSPEEIRFNMEERYYNDLKIVKHYKDELEMEPEFIGIRNLQTTQLYDIVLNNTEPQVCYSKKLEDIKDNTVAIFDGLFVELFGQYGKIVNYMAIINEINKKCYC